MRIYLIRHGERLFDGEDRVSPLTSAGRVQIFQLAQALSVFLSTPQIYLISVVKHARETAEILQRNLPVTAIPPITAVMALTPSSNDLQLNWEVVLAETRDVIGWSEVGSLACVGHEPRLSILAAQATSQEIRPLGLAQALIIEADGVDSLLRGRATITERVGVAAPEPEEMKEQLLQPKIQSKMQVSTFLAGFTFAALIAALTGDGYWQPSRTGWQQTSTVVAMVLLTWASAMFIASVYMFDRLAMPRQFWEFGKGDPAWRLGSTFNEDRCKHGKVYAHMLWIWRFVFTVAVFLAMAGFLFLILQRTIPLLTVAVVTVIAGVGSYYWKTRPNLGVD
jgi:phosphohistidine phosphatase SixA